MKFKPFLIALFFSLLLIPTLSAEERIFPTRRVYLSSPVLGETYFIASNQILCFSFAEIRNSTNPGRFGGPLVSTLRYREVITEMRMCGGKPCGLVQKNTVWQSVAGPFYVFDWGSPELGGVENQRYDRIYTFIIVEAHYDYTILQIVNIDPGNG